MVKRVFCGLAAVAIGVVLGAVIASGPSRADVALSISGFVPLPATRIGDTRTADSRIITPSPPVTACGIIPIDQLHPGKLPADSTWCLHLTEAVPQNATAVLLNVTAVDSDGPGYIQVWGLAGPISLGSNLNKTAGVTVANQVTTQLAPGPGGPGGQTITIVNQGSATNLVVDLEGYYLPVA